MKWILFLFIIPTIALADIITDCGEYTARGIVRAKISGIQLIVNEKTQSEYVISMPISEQGQIARHLDRDVIMKLVLDKKFDGQKGWSSKIISTENRIPNPLSPDDTGFKLDKKIPCLKY